MIFLQKTIFLVILLHSSLFGATNARIKPFKLLLPHSNMSGYIVKGVPVPIEKYPYNAMILNDGAMCGSSIINSWAVITAAHCFMLNSNIKLVKIYVGSEYISETVEHEISKIEAHENFNDPVSFGNDIAIVFVIKPFKLNNKVQKVLLINTEDWKEEHPDKNAFTVTGWGHTEYEGGFSKVGLQMARMKLIPLKRCAELNDDMDLVDGMFCLYGDGERDTCQGDSGGGVVWENMLVGIVSFGVGCAFKDTPGVYTNVYKYRDWIQQKIQNFYDSHCPIH